MTAKFMEIGFLKKYYKGKIYSAKEKDWSTEYLSAAVSVKTVKDCDDAIEPY